MEQESSPIPDMAIIFDTYHLYLKMLELVLRKFLKTPFLNTECSKKIFENAIFEYGMRKKSLHLNTKLSFQLTKKANDE